MRLDKYLADCGIGTRSEIKSILKKGMVTVNGVRAVRPDQTVTESGSICFQGRELNYEKYVYYMLHKPAGFITATSDASEKTVMELMKGAPGRDLFPVGRLDKDTEGLLLITNDGQLAHDLLSPKKHVDKVYFARVNGIVGEKEIEAFAAGIPIGDEKDTLPAVLELKKTIQDKSEVMVTVKEGRYHQIKRMFQAVGMEVIYLKRLSMGNLRLDENLPKGSYRKIERADII